VIRVAAALAVAAFPVAAQDWPAPGTVLTYVETSWAPAGDRGLDRREGTLTFHTPALGYDVVITECWEGQLCTLLALPNPLASGISVDLPDGPVAETAIAGTLGGPEATWVKITDGDPGFLPLTDGRESAWVESWTRDGATQAYQMSSRTTCCATGDAAGAAAGEIWIADHFWASTGEQEIGVAGLHRIWFDRSLGWAITVDRMSWIGNGLMPRHIGRVDLIDVTLP